ncbi:FadR/GntR family transcriptional regulator [Thalassotalea crassostreae]|uniref:FadR/GntR family transcriptional regulator n=1 Tax=Thalassotalea crassostreae TaxID=1763536 RepID=UPI000837FABF|nr:FadR/GntR family transcriptional regulator [Thalassotalea crassostreae]
MKNRRLFWQIVEKIETLIDSGAYPVGGRLPPERVLAETFNVSRPTIREAIIALEVREKVEVKTSSGVYVLAKINDDDSTLKISPFELTQTRALIEGEAAALAAATITEDELEQLKDTLVKMSEGPNPEVADKEFHTIISTATRNNALKKTIEDLWRMRETHDNIRSAYKNVCSQSDKQRLDEHTVIYKALKAGDSNAARKYMHEHFNRLINSLFEANEKKALEDLKRKTSKTRDLYSLNHLIE